MNKLHLLPPIKVAEELLLMDSCALRKIRPEELEGESWLGERKVELSPNITAMVDHFNSLALLVPTEILAETTSRMRAKVISSFITVAEACHQLKNYHSLKAVLAGLQCTPVYRLRKTWKKVPEARRRIFNTLSSLMAEEGNCMLYCKEIHKNLQSKVPFVPYLGFFLTQVVHRTCYKNMRDRQGMRRKGAIVKRYKILTSLTLPRSRPYKDTTNSTFSCANENSFDFNHSVGWSTVHNQAIPDIRYSCDGPSTALSSESINEKCFHSFSYGGSQCDNASLSLSHCYTHSASKTSSLSGSNLYAQSEHSNSSSTPSCMALSYHSTESLDLCGLNNELQRTHAVSQDMSASLFNLGPPEHGMNIRPTCSHSDTVLHRLKNCKISIGDEDNHYLSLSHLEVGSSSISASTGSPSPAQSRLSSPQADTSADNEQSSRHGCCGTQSAKSSGPTSSVEEDDESPSVSNSDLKASVDRPSTSIYYLGGCSVKNKGHDEYTSPSVQCLRVTGEDTYDRHASTIVNGDMWNSKCTDYAIPTVLLECRRNAIDVDIQDPKILLHMYQLCSLGCGIEIKERANIGNITSDYRCNTEAENYALSYQREPKWTCREASEGELDPSCSTLNRTRTVGGSLVITIAALRQRIKVYRSRGSLNEFAVHK